MDLSSIDLAKKYHSLEDEEWEKSGGTFIIIAAGRFDFNNNEFKSANELLTHIEQQSPKNVLVLYDSTTTPSLIVSVVDLCKKANVDKLEIKSTEGYGR
ncbi:hypothetical protein [Alteromonas sp. 009811495]|uniref:hypothetical protein n=1 Tax=Alteromonas sp. 009811495 TaxID=3002962 RepID=UPI00237DC6CE|nr:hypothetical protein [Alteromonas sp. 009811495]WDT86649.1 hypothetical protein OZ660_02560 [Alteromonas sp. 009811495]